MYQYLLAASCFLLAAQAAPLSIGSNNIFDNPNLFFTPLQTPDQPYPYHLENQLSSANAPTENQKPQVLSQVLNTALASPKNLPSTNNLFPIGNLPQTDNLFSINRNQLATTTSEPTIYYDQGCNNPNTCELCNPQALDIVGNPTCVSAEPGTYKTQDGNQVGKICPSDGSDPSKCIEYTLYFPHDCPSLTGSRTGKLCPTKKLVEDDDVCIPAVILIKQSNGNNVLYICPQNGDEERTTCEAFGTVSSLEGK